MEFTTLERRQDFRFISRVQLIEITSWKLHLCYLFLQSPHAAIISGNAILLLSTQFYSNCLKQYLCKYLCGKQKMDIKLLG